MPEYKNLLTIVLTLKDRSPFTYRWMDWMNESKCPYKILIADGGKDKNIENKLKNYDNYSNLNYEYIRYPYDENMDIFFKKWNDVMNRVNTPYLMLADNDDFIILDHFSQKIDFLQKNKMYSCFLGKLVTFDVLNTDRDNLVYGNDINFYDDPEGKDIDNEKASDRTTTALKSHVGSVWYSIMRTDIATTISKEVYEAKNKVNLTSEYYTFLLLSVYGKIKTDNKLHYIRQRNTSQVSEGMPFEGRYDYLLRLLTLDWQYDYSELVKRIVKHLNYVEDDLDEKDYLREYNKAYKVYIMPTIRDEVCNRKVRFFKLKTFILNSNFLSSLLLILQKILNKKISPIMSVSELKNEPSIFKLINFMKNKDI